MLQQTMHGAADIASAPLTVLASSAEAGHSPSLVPTRATWERNPHTAAKRAVDIVGAVVLLLVTLPVLTVAALGVRLTSPGPVLFRQRRVGMGARHFEMLKFRTFPVDHLDVEQSLPHEQCPLRFGRLLRRTSIDELPQLWNVLRGDMSLVGPRPERPHFAEALGATIPAYRERHRAPAGITGLAQVHGLCGPTSIYERVAADNRYIEGWTVWRDLRILLSTVPTVVRKVRW
jgi:lipopolysaccharide/colanic/teichoic acid biosynthesis glycosyltransferase